MAATSSTSTPRIEQAGSPWIRAHGAMLAVALLSFWVGAHRTLDRVSPPSVPSTGIRTHAAATRL